ncbi:MAG: alpha/beta hydrolase [Gammaproteobacteria bacterium]|nr:MAG: alpha/beta hydrolase [Gammaproteobacteria bacterium]UCH39566.1 MAG: alpha/beta hydrolase [Gammaproteobacteria bacterium]
MARFDLDSEMLAFIDKYVEVSQMSTAVSIEQQRSDYEAMVQHFRYAYPADISSRDDSIEGRHGAVPLRHYRRGDGDDRALILFVHGGGFILGSLDSHDDICAELCARTGLDLVSVDYRLSPEFYHPAHLDDVEDAFNALAHDNTILVGASAGGTLCAALCHRIGTSPQKPAGQVLIYPGLGGERFDLESYRVNADAPLLTSNDIRFYRGTRCPGDELPLDDPEFYPLLADDFSNIPATIAISADIDPLRDDTRLYVEKLQADGVRAEWINEAGMVHDYLRARHVSKAAAVAFARIADSIQRLAD